jgi:hypothetical protein
MKIKTGAALLAALMAIVVLYFSLSSPGRVVVNAQGEIQGFVNNIRETLQGNDFWKNQIREVELELERELNFPGSLAEMERDTAKMSEEFDQFNEEMYQQYPDLKPSETERQAEILRNRADQIEWAESERLMEELSQQRIAELENVLPLIRAKTK